MWFKFFLLALVLAACQNSPDTSKYKNVKGDYITRTKGQKTEIPPLQMIPSMTEKEDPNLPKITKEYFRCKGSFSNPIRAEQLAGQVVKHLDCGGSQKHSLPVKEGKEWIPAILIQLLNEIQTKTSKKVVITSGHRCPEHNKYVDASPMNQYSKHQIGAEVDFYVAGMEYQPEKILQIIFDHYKNHSEKDLKEFKRYEKPNSNVVTKPWMNKEIFIKLFQPSEGRNLDNRHPFPYISIQVRYDLERGERLEYSWDRAFREYLRY